MIKYLVLKVVLGESLEDKLDINNRLDSYNKSLKKIKLDEKHIKNHDDHLKVISKENKIEPDDFFYWDRLRRSKLVRSTYGFYYMGYKHKL